MSADNPPQNLKNPTVQNALKPPLTKIGRKSRRAAAIALVFANACCLTLSPSAFAASSDQDSLDSEVSLESLARLYSNRIEKIDLEIHNETQRRTAILAQLDSTINALSALEQERDVVTETSPELGHNLEQIHTEIAVIDQQLRRKVVLLDQMQTTLEKQPELSIWQAALGNPDHKTQHKQLATQRYLIHITQQEQQQLQSQRTLLNKKYQSIVAYNQNIDASIGALQSDADKLLQQRQHLEQQLTDVSAQIVAMQDRKSALTQRSRQMATDPQALHFSNLRGKLEDPVEGSLLRQFSEPKAKGLLKWKGVLIEAPLGLPFTAVADGLVVFADQLQGLGNVAILDHGEGFMSLYGMAELLLVEKGQLLLTGDPVGTVGESVGANTAALYFEVRHNADALDPQDWLEMDQIARKNTLSRLFSESK